MERSTSADFVAVDNTNDGGCYAAGPELTYDGLEPVPEYSNGLLVYCSEDSPLGYLTIKVPRSSAEFELADLTTAREGEVRRLPATVNDYPAEAVLTVVNVEGEYRGVPDGPTDDYLREFTVTLDFDCATAPNASCDYRVELILEGRQTAEDFTGQCGLTPDE